MYYTSSAKASEIMVVKICFKIGIAFSFVGFILHVVGFSTVRWATLTMKFSTSREYLRVIVHVGLWKHCGCTEGAFEHCICSVSPSKEPEWFDAVKAMETLGLIGWLSSGITCLTLVFYRQTKILKKFNIFFTTCSGVSIVIGLSIFGAEIKGELSKLPYVTKIEAYGGLSASFILCAVAAGIALLPCLSLFLIDLRSQMRIEFSNQGQVIYNPWRQAQVIASRTDLHAMARHVPEYGRNTLPLANIPLASGGYDTSNTQQQEDWIPYKV